MAKINLNFNEKSTEIKTFWIDATGDWQPISVPSGIEFSHIFIYCHDGNESHFNHSEDPQEFHYSSNPDGSEWSCAAGIEIEIFKDEKPICYAKAKNNKIKFAITLSKRTH